MATKRLDVILEDDEIELIKALAKHDGVTFKMEMERIFYTELQALKDLYADDPNVLI